MVTASFIWTWTWLQPLSRMVTAACTYGYSLLRAVTGLVEAAGPHAGPGAAHHGRAALVRAQSPRGSANDVCRPQAAGERPGRRHARSGDPSHGPTGRPPSEAHAEARCAARTVQPRALRPATLRVQPATPRTTTCNPRRRILPPHPSQVRAPRFRSRRLGRRGSTTLRRRHHRHHRRGGTFPRRHRGLQARLA